ncbi:flagellar biosynthetic protein FliR [Geomonas terrae]|uniref:Flagellar biosynthetic protein FliR n=1 Tax=Geomonas terrae TaxID=2562681 RepID=A0A4S1CM59_9BACT|nr:flagellar biosynthetic protein FliR [Geomonas terrae]TGU74895.1 flagellar biosynthetic protein FliR [Geomonas terrae]
MFGSLPLSTLADLIPFGLVLARVSGLFMAIPIFGARVVPNRVKAVLIFALTLLIFPIIRPQAMTAANDSISLILLVVQEALIGLTLGAISQFVFAAVELCGQLVGTQMGISIAAQFDPTTQNNVPTMAIFQGALTTLIFLSLGVHHFFIKAMVESYQVIPLGAWHVSGGLLKFMTQTSTGVFVIAIKLAAPVSVALLATTVALGIVARSFPAMNVFMVSMPLNIGIGFLLLGISLPIFLRVLQGSFATFTDQMRTLFRLLA